MTLLHTAVIRTGAKRLVVYKWTNEVYILEAKMQTKIFNLFEFEFYLKAKQENG
jgi:hypothetical protein